MSPDSMPDRNQLIADGFDEELVVEVLDQLYLLSQLHEGFNFEHPCFALGLECDLSGLFRLTLNGRPAMPAPCTDREVHHFLEGMIFAIGAIVETHEREHVRSELN